jgi:hypothetical protein
MEQAPPICSYCKHHIVGSACKAFNRIPDDIYLNQVDYHFQPREGDNGIIFEQSEPIPEFIFEMFPDHQKQAFMDFGIDTEVIE